MYNMGLLQIQIYTKKFFRTLRRESIVSVFIGIIITMLVMYVTQENMFKYYEGTKSGFFSLICVCIWIGIFNSIQLVCREKNDIVKDELDKSLRATSYMASHFIYQFLLCMVQSIIVFIVFMIFVGDKMTGSPLAYLITIFLIMYASDAMAFVISAAVPSPIVAMTVMPLLLLVQLVMAGVLFELNGMAKTVANFTVSKWGMSIFGMIGDITNNFPSKVGGEALTQVTEQVEEQIGMSLQDPLTLDMISEVDRNMYVNDGGEVFLCWLILIAFIVVFYFLSVYALKSTTKKMKK